MNDATLLSRELLQSAFACGASDIHFYPLPKSTAIYFRVHGKRILHKTLVAEQYTILLTYYKFTSGMDIGEIRKPQNGTLEMRDHASQFRYSLRLSTLPTSHTESLAIRILPQDGQYDLKKLFLFPNQLNIVMKWLSKKSGLILFTGPTGSGKTTTMYALLESYLKEQSCQAITLEDPIEKTVDDILQVQVNEKAGMTYQAGLKAALRHDPDILMVGEIRDASTAKFAFEAALTGHLVLSTLHAKNAVGTIHRLLEMGIAKSDIDQSLIAVASVDLLTISIGSNSIRRAAIMELLEGEHLEDVIWNNKKTYETYHNFEHLRKKAFAYGFIHEETYFSY